MVFIERTLFQNTNIFVWMKPQSHLTCFSTAEWMQCVHIHRHYSGSTEASRIKLRRACVLYRYESIIKGSNSASFMSDKHFSEDTLIKSSLRGKKSNWLLQKQRSQVHWRDEMSHEWSERKGRGRMDRGVFCSKRCVSTREKRWVIRDLEDCYRGRQFIPTPRSSRKEELRSVNGRVKTGKWVWQAGRWSAGMWNCTSSIVRYNKLSVRRWDQRQLLFTRRTESVCWFSAEVPFKCQNIMNNWVGSDGEIPDCDSFLKTLLQIWSEYSVQADTQMLHVSSTITYLYLSWQTDEHVALSLEVISSH